MPRFHLFWIRTPHDWDNGFVVARTARAASCFVRGENFIFEGSWATAERIATLPDHLQDPSVAVGSTDDDPRHAFWAAPDVLRACEIEIVHATSPRVFYWRDRLFTEGVLDYLRLVQDESDDPPGRPANEVAEAEGTPLADERQPN